LARSEIAVTEIVRAGVTPISQTTANATDDHYVANTGDVFLEVVSTDAGEQTVTIVANPDLSSDGLTVSDLVLTVGAGVTKLFGPFRTRTFKQAADSDRMYVNPSVSTTLKFRAYRLQAVT
jgi:hypothetical protein